MKNKEWIEAATLLVKKDFELESSTDFLTEAELLAALSDHVAYMMERELETLLSTLYRMDVQEPKVAAALLPNAPEPANVGLARLILNRQKQRIATKQTYQQPKNLDWFDF